MGRDPIGRGSGRKDDGGTRHWHQGGRIETVQHLMDWGSWGSNI